jgi:arylsulfatase A-like enzyme
MEPVSRRDMLLSTAALLGLNRLVSFSPPPAPVNRPPNVIIMLADDLGYGDIGCYGQTQIRTPNIDRLAQEGMRFSACYAGSPVCAPSRCCLITGQHTGHARIRGNDTVPLHPEDPSIGKLMQSAGYRTAIIGKWGLGEPDTTGIPNRQGFHEFYGYLNQEHAHDSYPTELWRNEKRETLEKNLNDRQGAYSNDLFCDEAIAFVERNRSKPFFLLWSHTIPHAFPAKSAIEVPEIEPEYRPKPWPEIERRFASVITRMDRHLGRMLQKLRELKLEKETLILFTSDNGPQAVPPHSPDFFRSSGGLRGVKRDLYEGGIRVPTIVRWRGRIREGTLCDHPWAFWDLYPTLAELTSQPVPERIDGVSILPAWLGKPVKPHPPFYWEFSERGFEQAVRMGKWKAVRHRPGGRLELYDLSTDPGETRDVADRQPKAVAEIERYLKTARTPSDRFPNG